MGVNLYNFADVIVIVGPYHITGFASGSSIKVERNSDSWTFQPNVDGGGTRSKSNNKSGRVTFSLAQTSGSNDDLSTLVQIDELTSGGSFPLSITDNNGNSLHSAETAWIVKPATSEYGAESAGREWILETDNLVHFVGGN